MLTIADPASIAAASGRQARACQTLRITTTPTGTASATAVTGRVIAQNPTVAASAISDHGRCLSRYCNRKYRAASQRVTVSVCERKVACHRSVQGEVVQITQ